MNTSPRSGAINLHIDKIVLHGFTRINEAAWSSALQAALGRELRAALALRDANYPTVHASVTLPAHYNAQTLGSALALSLTGIACSGMSATDGSRND
jgi:hypothetical protein